jgi:hypothetical protein
VAGWWFSPDTPVSSTNKTDRHDITEILLKVAVNTITFTLLWRQIKMGQCISKVYNPCFLFLNLVVK